ncbi:MAG TPA: hypothetical protein VFF43_01120, partial [Caldimonas sp.]|nr:hypothetical protein [Caldimonas sp.]
MLENNGGDDVTVSANGPFAFPTSLANGAAFAVGVRTQPAGPAQTCTVANGSGNVAGADARAATVTCTTNTYHVSGSISNLTGTGLVLQLNGGNDLIVGPNATQFTFPAAVASGTDYLVTVHVQPGNPAESCYTNLGGGTVAAADVNVPINCVAGGRNLCIQGNPAFGSLEYVLRQDGPTIVHAANVSADETWAGDGAVHVIP